MIERDTNSDVGSAAARPSESPPPLHYNMDREPSPAAAETFVTAPIGGYLRSQRRLRDVSIEELSASTRIPLRSLERLERGEFDGETDGFARVFVRTVAIALGLDVEDAISRMLQEPEPGVWERHSSSRRLKQILATAALLVLCVTGVVVARAGWNVLVGASDDDPDRAVVIWRDPVRALAEATGAEVDPSLEIDPAEGSRTDRTGAMRLPENAQALAPLSTFHSALPSTPSPDLAATVVALDR